MLFHVIKIFIKQCKLNSKFTFLTSVCLISSFFSLVFLLERGYSQYVVDVNTEQETQVLYLTSLDEARIKELYYKIVDDPILPQLTKATVSGNVYSGVFWNTEQEENTYYVPYGRFFSGEEILTNAKVALIGTGYLSLFSYDEIDSIWRSGIKINDSTFEAIGTYNYNWGDGSSIPSDAFCFSPMPNAVTIPINCFFELGLNATKMRCVFTESLSEEQYSYLVNLLASYNDLQDVVIPKTERMNQKNRILRMIENVAPFAAIVFLSVINIANIVMYWLRTQFKRLQIYRICGSGNGAITFFVVVQVSLLVLIGFGFSCVAQATLRVVLPSGVTSRMPISFYMIVLGSQWVAMVVLVLMKSMRLIVSENLVCVND